MTLKFFLVILFFSTLGCSNLNFEDKTIIKGDLGNGENGEVYLVDISKKDVIKDSTKVNNGHFNFTYKSTSSFLPFEAMLCMWDEYQGMKSLRPIGFINPFMKNAIESIFYVDRGITSIGNKIKIDNHYIYEIKGSKQNEPYYKHLEFVDLNKNQNANERKRAIANDLGLIAKYPYSFYLINMLYINREQYTSDELKLLMDEFSAYGKSLLPYNKLNAWLAYKQKSNPHFVNVILENENSTEEHIFDNAAKINMIVFWASWCGPCRREIPYLKEIYVKYHNKGLSMTSISIDNNKKNWKAALTDEQMPWKQLIINDSAKNTFDLEYNISEIPLVVLFNKKNEVIHQFTGISQKEEFERYISIKIIQEF